MDGIRLEINIGTKSAPNWQVAYLEDDVEISVEENSPLWNDASTYSYGFNLPFEPNRHILGNIDEMFGRSIYKVLYRKQFRLWVQGLLWLTGTIDLDDEIEMDDSVVEINLTSGNKLLEDLLEGVNAQDVELYTNIDDMPSPDAEGIDADEKEKRIEDIANAFAKNVQIGWTNAKEAYAGCSLWMYKELENRGDKTFKSFSDYMNAYQHNGHVHWGEWMMSESLIDVNIPQLMVPNLEEDEYSSNSWGAFGITDFTNMRYSYDPVNPYSHPYCNIKVCSQKYELKVGGTEGEESDYEKVRGYRITDTIDGVERDVMDEYRYQSSPCFYVLFWLDKLLREYLGVNYDISAVTNIPDMKALCFVNTKCKYEPDPYMDPDRKILGHYLNYSKLWGDQIIRASDSSDKWYIGMNRSWNNIPLKFCSGYNQDTGDTYNCNLVEFFPYSRWAEVGHWTVDTDRWNKGPVTEARWGYQEAVTWSYSDRLMCAYRNPKEYQRYYGPYFVLGAGENDDLVEINPHITARLIYAEDDGRQKFQLKFDRSNPLANRAFATGANFPDVDAYTVIESLEKGFGMKFLYSEDTKRVEVVLYRDILRQNTAENVDCFITEVYKKENNVRGFKLHYSAESSKGKNKLTGETQITSGGDDTTYSYNDYKQKVTSVGTVVEIQNGNQELDYCRIITTEKSSTNQNLYISNKTGNAFRWKVDSNASKPSEWYPSMFEVGGSRGVEIGDCRDDNVVAGEVIDISIPFTPIIPNDVNHESQITMSSDDEVTEGAGKYLPEYRLFCDIEYHQRSNFAQVDLLSGLYSKVGEWTGAMNELKIIDDWAKTVESDNKNEKDGTYIRRIGDKSDDPSKWKMSCTNSDNEPIYNMYLPNLKWYSDEDDTYNPFNSIGGDDIMFGFLRPGTEDGNAASGLVKDFSTSNYDNEGNYKCRMQTAGRKAQVTGDSCDVYGNVYSTAENPDPLSLKIKAEKPYRGDERPFRKVGYSVWVATDVADRTRYPDYNTGDYYVVDYDNGNPLYYEIDSELANRGLYDKFYVEYAHFVLNRKIAVVTIPSTGIELTKLRNLEWKKRYKFGEISGWINNIKYSVDQHGVGEVKIEIYYI